MYNNLPHHKKVHMAAIFAAVALHGGIAPWAMQPKGEVEVKQQVIKISMVAPSSIAQPKQTIAQAEPAPVVKQKPDAIKVKKKIQKKSESKPEVIQEKASATPPTSGPQSPDAIEKVTAHSDPVFNAAYLHNPAPVYPQSARKKGDQGKVMLEVEVTSQGTAREVSIARSSGFSLLDEAARDAVKNWNFIPAKRGDEIVEARIIVPVEFKLN